MGQRKLRIHQTNSEVLVANLRGEVGEVIVTWTLLRSVMSEAARKRSDNVGEDLKNQHLVTLHLLADKLSDEMVSRLSELGEEKIGRLNFYFAAERLNFFKTEAKDFSRFVRRHHFKKKRDQDISHKTAPQSWHDDDYIRIPYRTMLKGLSKAIRLIKKIDRLILGPSAPYLWRKARERRYKPLTPPRVSYLILPHIFLSAEERAQIITAEMMEGRAVWEPLQTKIDGQPAIISAYRKWGAIALGDTIHVLEHYPLNELTSVNSRSRPAERPATP